MVGVADSAAITAEGVIGEEDQGVDEGGEGEEAEDDSRHGGLYETSSGNLVLQRLARALLSPRGQQLLSKRPFQILSLDPTSSQEILSIAVGKIGTLYECIGATLERRSRMISIAQGTQSMTA